MAAAEDSISFNRQIRPILSDKCFACHGPSEESRKAGLRLDIADGEQGAHTPRGDSYIIKAESPEESELWRRITTDDPDDLMPPEGSHKAPLNTEQLDAINQWISEGANYQEFWSFIPPAKAPLASVNNADWGQSFIDNRVLAKLEKKGLQPNGAADKRTLLRRITFDLTGLPPTLEEIDAFLSDDSPDAYAKVVDGLLARDSYGEHMTRYWADLVRLADTNGMHKDFHRNFTTYRDWLIRAFNSNLPYDDFVKYQLAGDLYPEPTQDQLVASGFNRLHLIIDVGTALPEESLHKNVLDRVAAFGTTFLGLTVQCAQCHDHKYDPISQKDFFQIYAFFNNFAGDPETTRTPERGLQPPFIYLTDPAQEAKLAAFDRDKARLEELISKLRERLSASPAWPDKFEKVSVPWIWNNAERTAGTVTFRTTVNLDMPPVRAVVRYTGMSSAAVQINGASLGTAHTLDGGIAADASGFLVAGENIITARADGDAGFAFILEYGDGEETRSLTSSADWQVQGEEHAWKPAVEIFTPEHENTWTEKVTSEGISNLSRDLQAVEDERSAFVRDIPAAMVMREMDPPRPTTMLIRGAYDAPGAPVYRNTPAFLPALKQKESTYTRMDLAEWLVDPKNPLTARVEVNRLWQQFFGVGLVKTSEDFGAQGEPPSHPDLLDDLALYFVESGWDIKALVREIVLSNTYQQASDASPDAFKRDPENRLLARGSRYRMDAEMIRDQILAVSGQLNRTMYGESVKPPQPPGLWEMVSMAAPMTYVADTDDNIYRRSLYTYWRRGIPPPQMTIMNAPSREFCVARRERTNTPLQALLLMNEQEYLKAAKACVTATVTDAMSSDEGLGLIYEKITSEVPSAQRLQLMEQTLKEFRGLYADDPEMAALLTPEMSDASPAERVELAAWTMVTHSLLNLELAKVRR